MFGAYVNAPTPTVSLSKHRVCADNARKPVINATSLKKLWFHVKPVTREITIHFTREINAGARQVLTLDNIPRA